MAHIVRKEYLGNLTLTGKRSKGKQQVKYLTILNKSIEINTVTNKSLKGTRIA